MNEVVATIRSYRLAAGAFAAALAVALAWGAAAFARPVHHASTASVGPHPVHLGGTIFARARVYRHIMNTMTNCGGDYYVMEVVAPLPGDPHRVAFGGNCTFPLDLQPGETAILAIDPAQHDWPYRDEWSDSLPPVDGFAEELRTPAAQWFTSGGNTIQNGDRTWSALFAVWMLSAPAP